MIVAEEIPVYDLTPVVEERVLDTTAVSVLPENWTIITFSQSVTTIPQNYIVPIPSNTSQPVSLSKHIKDFINQIPDELFKHAPSSNSRKIDKKTYKI